jgi:cytochrome P450
LRGGGEETIMDIRPEPFEPPAPIPRTVPPSRLEIIKVMFRNPLELWGAPSYSLPYIQVKFFGRLTTIANHPGLIRHVLVDNAANYAMQPIRQLVLRPILRDGLLTAEGAVWKRSRKAMAPVFTPRHARGFAGKMLRISESFAERYDAAARTA